MPRVIRTEEDREKYRAYMRKWSAAHRESIRARWAKAWASRSPEQRARDTAKSHAWYAAHREENFERVRRSREMYPEKWKTYSVARRRRIREERAERPRPEYCEVCGRPPAGNGKVLHFDHDHATGAFRGWLCSKCNVALGLASDDPVILRALADYLERSRRLRVVR